MEITILSFSNILKKIKEDLHFTNFILAGIMNCDVSAISLYLNGKTPVPFLRAILLKDYLQNSFGLDIYEEYLFKFDNDGYFFHGSKSGIIGDIRPDYSLRNKTDFSKGFYLGETFKQASTFISEEEGKDSLVYRFSFDTSNLNGIELKGLDWIFFIAYNRGKIQEIPQNQKIVKKMKSIISENHDYIFGDIADDRMSQSMEDFFADRLTYGQVLECLTQLNIGKQYCLKTTKACRNLTCTGIYRLDETYRSLIRDYAISKRNHASEESVKISKRVFSRGRYFSDMVKQYGNE